MITLKNIRIILAAGLLIAVIAQILVQLSAVGDLAAGALHGVGIGLLVVGLYATRRAGRLVTP